MKIQVLGTGCPKCAALAANAAAAISETGADAELVKVTDVNEIIAMGAVMTPALAIDGEIQASGRVPPVDEIKEE